MAKKTEKFINYEASFDELQAIVKDIETGEISVDELSEKVKRASELINECRKVLYITKARVEKVLEDLDQKTENKESEN